MTKLFISHSSQDDSFVRELRVALADHGQQGWIDSRELRGGDPLWPSIQQAIAAASAFTVVVSPDALQSKWVGQELRHALDLRKLRGRDQFPVFALVLDGTKLGVLETFFDEEPIYLPVSSGAGGVAAAMNAILVALGQRLPADVAATPQPQAEPLEELVLELTDLKFDQQDGLRRASARARLIYEPATAGQREVASDHIWRLVAPLGPIEANELRWYLEKYAIWPSRFFNDRARQVEADLVTWGRLLHDAALPVARAAKVMQAWATIDSHAGRRFSVHVDAALEDGASPTEIAAAREAATQLLGLPWELLHDGDGFLFQGAKPTRVRRRLPNTKNVGVPIVATPIRILLVTARPDDDACRYIDHRVSALPLVEAMESLPGLVEITILCPPTLSALSHELERARAARQPYHVVHFDGHGVYDQRVGLGGLCFERPEDQSLLDGRQHVTVFTDELGPLLREHRIPLVFLEACQTAQAEQASESVASELLKVGVASVVAMSHSVLVETARRFVAVFYRALAEGKRVGDAMLAGQRDLKDDTFRGQVFGEGELRLEDWFVPVLFQEKDDPQLFKITPSQQTVADFQTRLATRLGALPPVPTTGFVGRSRELLALQRLLTVATFARTWGAGGAAPHVLANVATANVATKATRYAVIRGQGGEGKTSLAAEFARWMIRSQQMTRAAFVSVETLSDAAAVLDAIGRQLVGRDYSVATFKDWDTALQPVERVLTEQATLLVIDNMESILLPPFMQAETPEALSESARQELDGILKLCVRLLEQGDTRLIFTSREPLPAPFDAPRNRRELQQLAHEDAIKLVERVLDAVAWDSIPSARDGIPSYVADARREEIEQLVEAVHGHARTLALLAPALQARGVTATRESLVELMREMHDRFPTSREQSVFASVELSLRRMSPANQERARVLGVFHGGVNLSVLPLMTEWDESDIGSLADELIATGLATPNRFQHLTLNPALCPYLRGRLDESERESLTARWVTALRGYVEFLVQQQHQQIEVASTLTLLELPNLFALLDLVQRAADAEAMIALATSLYSLLRNLGKPRLLERVGQARDTAAAALGDTWNHARFEAARTRIEQQLGSNQLREAFAAAQQLLQRALGLDTDQPLSLEDIVALLQRSPPPDAVAYPIADYDLAMACWLLARVLRTAGESEQALPLLAESRQRFEAVEQREPGCGAAGMASACFTEQGDCLLELGRLGAAAVAYEEAIDRDEKRGATRDVAVGQGQLGTVRMLQRRYPEALAAHSAAREQFTQLDEPGTVAVSWHQTGMVYQRAGQPDAAEDAYRKSLAIKVRQGNVAGQASTLLQLGNLYGGALDRPEEAVAFYRQAADKFVVIGDAASEGGARNNLAITLRKLGRLKEARQEIRRAINCGAPFGHASQPWMSWAVMADIETDSGNASAAADAKGQAIASYLAYRRDGGENHFPQGRVCIAVTQSLLTGDVTAAASLLQQLAADPATEWLIPFIRSLQAIVAGSRDRALADDPQLDHTMAAEILWLIEQLDPPRELP